ncbi:MAG TPA: hypothetical protein VH331_14820 [Allosphingosinicella sp.]|nr:hypothetical protein [Allosphingosinicella sp.]
MAAMMRRSNLELLERTMTAGTFQLWQSDVARTAAAILLCVATLSAPALADTTVATPAEKYAVNPGGVDMRTGAYVYKHTDLAIGGTDESGGLTLTRSQIDPRRANQPFGNQTHNWDINLTLKRVSLGTNNYQNFSGNDYQVAVHFGGRSRTFNAYYGSSGFTEVSQADFATLTVSGDPASGAYTFTAADGTVATFRPLSNVDCAATGSGAAPACAVISQIVEADGTTFTFNYDYNASAPAGVDRARLKSIVSSRGYGMVLEANPATGNLITKACVLNLTLMTMPANGLCPSNAQAATTYAYTNFNGQKLSSMTDPTGGIWGFNYAGSSTSYTMGYVKPGQSSPWLTNTLSMMVDEDYGSYELVSSQSFSDGQSYSYLYDMTPTIIGHTPESTIAGGSYTDAMSETTTVHYSFPLLPGSKVCKGFNPCPPYNYGSSNYTYQLTSGPTSIEDPDGHTWSSDYCDPNEATVPPPNGGCLVTLLQDFTDPEGIKTDLTYDGNRNIIQVVRHSKPGSGIPDVVTSATYDVMHPKSSNKPLTATDASGNTTTYTYDPNHGGVLTETDPAVNGITPQKRYTYAQRYAWISDGGLGFVRAATPVWMLTQMSFCKAGNPSSSGVGCANGASDEVITTYDYGPDAGPNNLNLRGTVVDAGALSLRTCTSYDVLGNKISETKPRAGLASCP